MKKVIKDIRAVLVVLFIFLTFIVPVQAQDKLTKYGTKTGYDTLSLEEKKIYKGLEKACNKFQKSEDSCKYNDGIAVEYRFSCDSLYEESARAIVYALIDSHPEYFWYDGYYYGNNNYHNESYINLLCQKEYRSGKKRLAVWNEIKKVIETDYLSLITDEMPDYEKEYILHNALVANVSSYGGNYLADDELWGHSIVGAFGEYKKVTGLGYARAFSLLMSRAGVECRVVIGKLITEEEVYDQAWNQICLDGEFYNVDVFWDDPVNSDNESIPLISYDYYNYCDKDRMDCYVNPEGWQPRVSEGTKYSYENVCALLQEEAFEGCREMDASGNAIAPELNEEQEEEQLIIKKLQDVEAQQEYLKSNPPDSEKGDNVFIRFMRVIYRCLGLSQI